VADQLFGHTNVFDLRIRRGKNHRVESLLVELSLRYFVQGRRIVMDKLHALHVLSHAYWYIRTTGDIVSVDSGDFDAAFLLDNKFNYVRRSLTLTDLEPTPVEFQEGYNGRMPAYF
jgi:hypothetical protein